MKRKKSFIMFFLFTFLFHGFLGAMEEEEKRADVNYRNTKLNLVFDDLSRKFAKEILYNHEEVKNQPGITYQAKNETLKVILDHCLQQTNLTYKFVDDIVVISYKKESTAIKTFRVTGKVSDEKGEPIPGATVLIPARKTGVVTNHEGVFSVEMIEGENLLQISFIGMKTQTVDINPNQKHYNIILKEERQEVDEVVVTGYANVNKKSFTGTSVQVSGEQLMKVSPNNIIQSLQLFDPSFRMMTNNAMGSDPNTLPEFYIRGRSGIGNTALSSMSESELRNNPNLPTFILDGYEVNVEKIYDLDPSLVKSITILKDAASTAIYGSRAANGVVVIETISPEEGELRVTYVFNGGLSTPDLSVYHLLDARAKLELELLAGIYDAKATDLPSVVLDKQKPYYEKLSEINRGVDTYWLSQPVRTAFSHKHNANISGGSKKLRYGINLKLDQTNGVMKESERRRMSLGVNLSYRVKDVMFSNNLEWASTHSENSPYGNFSTYATRNPYDTFLNEDGTYKEILPNWNTERSNPLYNAHLMSFDKNKNSDISNNFSIKWFVSDHFRIEGRVAIRSTFSSKRKFVDPEHSQFTLTKLEEKGSLSVSNTNSSSWDVNIFMAYNKSFNKHHLSATLGGNMKESNDESSSYQMKGFASGSTSDQNFAATYSKPTGGSDEKRLIGAFLSINYTYNDIYLFDFSGRYDGASQFGRDNKFAPFYSIGVGLNIHNYDFIKNNLPWIDNLKIRGTFGILGNASFNQNLSKKMYEYNFSNWYIDGIGATIRVLGNPELKWERSQNLDLGLDLRLFKHFNATLGYYRKVTNDLIGDITIPASTGFSSYKSNLGKVMNEGVEVSVNVAAIQKRDFSLSLYGTMAHNKNTLKEISDGLKDYNQQVEEYFKDHPSYNYPLLRYHEGASLTSIYSMRSLGINPADGKEIYLRKDGTPTYEWDPSQHVICGDTEPTISGSFGINLNYKGLFVFSGFMYECGGDMENRTLYGKVENANVKVNVDERVFSDRWQQPGDVAKYKALKDWQKTTRSTSRFIQKNNFISFNSITVGYDFPVQWIKKIGIRTLKAQFSANDLGRFSTIKVERGTSYPFARTYNFSVNVGF